MLTQAAVATILVAETDPLLLTLVTKLLSMAGHRVLPTSSAAEALRRCTSEQGPVDLLVTDLHLGSDSGGLNLATQLQRVLPSLKVLFMRPGRIDLLPQNPGRCDYLAQPFSPEDLRNKVQHVLRGGQPLRPV